MTNDLHTDDAANHATDGHSDDHGHDDDGHAPEPLGPVDVRAWGAGALGLLAGLAVALAFYVATIAPVTG